jgi:hypothetical protein
MSFATRLNRRNQKESTKTQKTLITELSPNPREIISYDIHPPILHTTERVSVTNWFGLQLTDGPVRMRQESVLQRHTKSKQDYGEVYTVEAVSRSAAYRQREQEETDRRISLLITWRSTGHPHCMPFFQG